MHTLSSQIMERLLQIFSNRSATVHEEAMLAVGAFSYALGKQFMKYLQAFVPYLKMGLTNYQEWQVSWDVCFLSAPTALQTLVAA